MKERLLGLLCCPCCQAGLELRKTKVLTGAFNDTEEQEVCGGTLTCSRCSKQYPVVNGIPRLCDKLSETEIRALRQFQTAGDTVTEAKKDTTPVDVYCRIEQLVRQRLKLPENASDYLRKRVENDVYFRVRGCEEQEKYVNTLRLHCDETIQSVLDVGGGQGGLMKCLNDHLRPFMSIIVDYDLSWLEVARLRNPTTQVVRADATKLPFKSDSIDLVISQSMLEHIEEHDKALADMCRVAKKALFICFGPNKFSAYDIGHLDAPIAIFPKRVGKYIAILWHRIRRTGRSSDSIISELSRTYYISTSHVRRILGKYGRVRNVFTDFMLFSIKSDYAYRMRRIRQTLAKHPSLARFLFNMLVVLRIEPQSYYILKKAKNT